MGDVGPCLEHGSPPGRPYLDAPIRAVDVALVAVSSPLGVRTHPVTGHADHHCGIDVPVPVGTPVVACGDGVVRSVYGDAVSGIGVRVRHEVPGGVVHVACVHLDRVDVDVGDVVVRGQVLGASGATGRVTGPHVHIEARWEVAGRIGGRALPDPQILDPRVVLGWGGRSARLA